MSAPDDDLEAPPVTGDAEHQAEIARIVEIVEICQLADKPAAALTLVLNGTSAADAKVKLLKGLIRR
jgi:hypothetical protein